MGTSLKIDVDDIFQNGACDIYAQELHNRYGYRICYLLNRTGRLVHAYCVDGKGTYIDARGRFEVSEKEFLAPYMRGRKFHKVIEWTDYSLEPSIYSDVYRKANFDEAKQQVKEAGYRVEKKKIA